MAKVKPSIPKGTRDFGPIELKKRSYILNTIETVFKKYGFMPIETPSIENLSTLEGKYGDEGDKLLFRILNSGDAFKEIREKNSDEKISNFKFQNSDISEKGLRYDLTVPFARYVVQHQNEIVFPFRRYQMQPVWRADRPQKNRYREFWQCDADVIGSNSLLNELDLILLYDEAFRKLQISKYELRINNRKILQGIAEIIKGKEFLNSISIAIDKLDKIGEDEVKKELIENKFAENECTNLFKIFKLNGTNSEKLLSLKNILSQSTEGLKGIEELEFVINSLKHSSTQSPNLKIDLSLARGLGYYTGCIFEVTAGEGTIKSSIGGGGRYDNLTENFGLDNISGVGISFGLDRIYDVMDELKLFPENLKANNTKLIFCYFDEASQNYCLQAINKVRNGGIASEIYPDIVKKISKQLDYANKLEIQFAAIAGENEMKEGKFMFKDLFAGTQELLSIENIIEKLK